MTTHANSFQVSQAVIRVARLLGKLGIDANTMHLHQGNGSYRIANALIVDRRNVWPNVAGGHTKSDALHALTVMEHTLQLILDNREQHAMPVAAAFAIAGREIPDAVA